MPPTRPCQDPPELPGMAEGSSDAPELRGTAWAKMKAPRLPVGTHSMTLELPDSPPSHTFLDDQDARNALSEARGAGGGDSVTFRLPPMPTSSSGLLDGAASKQAWLADSTTPTAARTAGLTPKSEGGQRGLSRRTSLLTMISSQASQGSAFLEVPFENGKFLDNVAWNTNTAVCEASVTMLAASCITPQGSTTNGDVSSKSNRLGKARAPAGFRRASGGSMRSLDSRMTPPSVSGAVASWANRRGSYQPARAWSSKRASRSMLSPGGSRRVSALSVPSYDPSINGSTISVSSRSWRQSIGTGTYTANLSVQRSLNPIPYWLRQKVAPLRSILKGAKFQALLLALLLVALFVPELWVLMDPVHDSDWILDAILLVIMSVFSLDLVVQALGQAAGHLCSFFFWTDLIGTASLVMDLSWVDARTIIDDGARDAAPMVTSNLVILRAARLSKLGARAGRLLKVLKMIWLVPGMARSDSLKKGKTIAKVLSAKLLTAVSVRISLLITLMVLLLPIYSIWTYPDQDWSMLAWVEVLQDVAKRRPETLPEFLREFEAFYDDIRYFPYRLIVHNGPAGDETWELQHNGRGGPPRRTSNVIRIESGDVTCYFNFLEANKVGSIGNSILLLVTMVAMAGFALLLNTSVAVTALRQLEDLIQKVDNAVATIFKSVNQISDQIEADTMSDDSEPPHGLEDETMKLERVVEKLAALGELVTQKHGMDTKAMETKDAALFNAYIEVGMSASLESARWSKMDASAREEEEDRVFDIVTAQLEMLEEEGLTADLVHSWRLNPLELDKERCRAAAVFFLGSMQGRNPKQDNNTIAGFIKAVESEYLSVPYHSWYHAVDVAHAMYRVLILFRAEAYLTGLEQFAMVVSAVAHDVGHPGVNNGFLVSTGHELALRYNDRSPLENMHCASLFQIAGRLHCNIFAMLTKKEFMDVRKVCIEAIMSTDNAHHFQMQKDVQLLYEVHSEILDESRQCYRMDEDFLTQRTAECFRQADTKMLLVKAFLHMSDISNPTKPFRVSRVWAQHCLQEFFLQGDKEKSLGIPVQALNDREKVNMPMSQVTFIEFFVAPFSFAVTKVLPPYDECVVQLLGNCRTWQKMWVTDTQPRPSDEEQRTLDERILKLERRLRSEVSRR
mmetsp:Transcript_54188/g.129072  ORF Transcript_54188/g.129072 Transcript_54188/m.129072 type:complete len:1134 (+) Transcript_54188:102-3503(+)